MRYVLCLVVLSLLCCKTDSTPLVRNQFVGGALGTSYSIICFTAEQTDLEREIDSVFKVLNTSLSTYIPDSDISKINRGDTTIVVDHMFREVFQLSRIIYTETKGAFDPTVGALVNAWGFGPEKAIAMDSSRVDSILKFVGFDKVALASDNTIRKLDSRTYFDFNAIAKGYAIDRLGYMLDRQGITNYLIEVGGEVVTKGKNTAKNKPWTVGVDDPKVVNRANPKVVLQLTNNAMASSGNYRKFRVDPVSGKKYVHTIDPQTGFTKNSDVLAATVIAPNCASADAYATAFMAMDLDRSIALLKKKQDLEGYIIYSDTLGVIKEYKTDGFAALELH